MGNGEIISVVLGSYNGADFIRETIDSILRQTYKNIELILVDDGSLDETLSIMRSYEKIDKRVTVLHQENKGASAAREAGYREATGDYIILSDDDDVWNPNLLFDLLKLAEKNVDIDAIVTLKRKMKNPKSIINYSWEKNEINDIKGKPERITGHEYALMTLARGEIELCIFWGALYKKCFMDKMVEKFMEVKEKLPTHYFNDTFASSVVFGMANQIIVTNRVQILYRVDSNSISHKSTVSLHTKHYMYAGEEALIYYKSLGWEDVYNETLPGWYLFMLRTWFMIYAHEKNDEERNYYFAEINRLYNKYLPDLQKTKRNGMKKRIVYYSILLWKKHPKLWFHAVKVIRRW